MKRQSVNPSVLKMPECPVVFYLPFSRLPLSSYAEMTNQTVRAVQQQANSGKLPLTSAQPGKERQVNMVHQFLEDFYDAQEKLQQHD
ncbi:hypothetical protein AIE71_21825 [Salmonella enterica subsp. enterica]|nr:hypothetical protein [Salmonella enterica subsp. enterica]EEA7994191.1 hypothetical protein [Salmonella enterica subsp. enterica]